MDNFPNGFDHLTVENRQLIELALERDRLYQFDYERLIPILFRPCRVRVLLVTDGVLDFSLGDFGLRTFVETLRTMPGYYVRFDITLGHIDNVTDDAVMVGHPGIVRSIKQFKFDDPSHFDPQMYDEVWLFGFATSYSRGPSYPSDRLSDNELRALSQFMDQGGGLFATGDHGALGVCLSGAIPRARSMRLWGDTTANNDTNEVSMAGRMRNDTNRLGHDASSQFNDQSDDVPQPINPKMYWRWGGIWQYSFPHPLLCGPNGVIRVLPDHPHEGQCVEPINTGLSDTFSGYTITEYPAGAGGFPRPLPEVIATSTVLAGTTSGIKDPTESQQFGAIGAYNGHLANVGRVVTDATWHHYVNVNFIGDSSAPSADPKRFGFLATPAGQAHLENIKAYHRNIAVWISRTSSIACMRSRILWGLLWHHRVIEAVATHTEVSLQKISARLVLDIGRHARDVLGLYAGRCQSRSLVLDLIRVHIPRDFLIKLDPWIPIPKPKPGPDPDPVPWFDPDPILDLALGGALAALREEFSVPDIEIRDRAEKVIDEVVERGVRFGVDLATRSMRTSSQRFSSLMKGK